MARGDGSVYQHGNWYWIVYYKDGKKFREAARDKDGKNTDNLDVASKYLRGIVDRIREEQNGGRSFVTPKSRKMKVGELLDALKTDFELRHKASPQNLSYIE